MHPGHAHAQLKAQVLVVTQRFCDRHQVLAGDVNRQLTVGNDDPVYGSERIHPGLTQVFLQVVHALIKPAPVRLRRLPGHHDFPVQLTVTGNVAGAVNPERVVAHPQGFAARIGVLGQFRLQLALRGGLQILSFFAHAISPFMSFNEAACSAAASALRMASSRFLPKGSTLMWSRKLSNAPSSISGRGGQPGR